MAVNRKPRIFGCCQKHGTPLRKDHTCAICRRDYEHRRYWSVRQRPRKPAAVIARRRSFVTQLSDGYVRRVLSKNTRIPTAAWPDALVELKRMTISLKRELHERGKLNLS